jgi:hypothetical protein
MYAVIRKGVYSFQKKNNRCQYFLSTNNILLEEMWIYPAAQNYIDPNQETGG